MTPKSNYLIGGLAVAAAMICALPVAQGIGASAKGAPMLQINRAAKGDRMIAPISTNVKKKAPDQSSRQDPLTDPEPAERAPLMDGCEPAFSPVTVPSMAHLASRCIG
jgi:hypothetical protein